MTEELLEKWLEAWSQWLDEILAAGVAGFGERSRTAIAQWANLSEMLGMSQEALLSSQLLDEKLELKLRCAVFMQLLSRHAIARQLGEINRLEDYLNQNS